MDRPFKGETYNAWGPQNLVFPRASCMQGMLRVALTFLDDPYMHQTV